MPENSIPPLEDLLAHRRWVQGVARRLLRDEHAAEDLAQETWVRAMRSPPDPQRDPKPWLRRVLKNLASNARRGQGRRQTHETAWRELREQRSPEDLVAEAEQHRRLVDLLMDLEEPFKTALVLRFYEGLGPKEIAERLEIPVGTVHSRIARAVERLKTRLDAEENGNRRAWIAGLLPLAGLDRIAPAAAASATTTSLAGILAMILSKPKVALLTLLLVGSLVGGGIWLASDSHGDDPGTGEVADLRSLETEPTLTGRGTDRVADVDPATRRDDVAATRPVVAEARIVRGTVRDAAGHPVEGAEVYVLPAGSPGLGDDELDLPRFGRAQAAPDGAFEVRLTEKGPVRLLAFAKGHVAGSVLLDETTSGAPVDLALGEPWRLRVRVTDAEGRWPADFGVELRDRMINPIDRAVDPHSQYLDIELAAPVNGNVHDVALHRTGNARLFTYPARGMAAVPAMMEITQPTEEVSIRVVRSGQLTVQILDASTGQPLDAVAQVTGWMGRRAADYAAWSFWGPGPQHRQHSRIAPGTYELEFEAPGYEKWTGKITFQSEGEARSLDVPLKPRLRGTSEGRLVLDLVTDQKSSKDLLEFARLRGEGSPLSGPYEIFARMREGDLWAWGRAWGTSGGWAHLQPTARDNGSIEVQESLYPLPSAHMPAGTYDLYVAERGTGRAAFVPGLRVFGDRESRYDVRLEPGTMLSVSDLLPEAGVFTHLEVRSGEAGALPLVAMHFAGWQTFNTPTGLEYLLRTPRKPLRLGPFPAASVEVLTIDEHGQTRSVTVRGAGTIVR